VTLDTENNPEAAALYSAVRRGDISGMSFGFRVKDEEWIDAMSEHPTRIIKSISKVIEVSACTFPAYDSSEIQARSKETLESEMRAYEVRKNNELIFDSTRAEKSASLKEMLEEAICKASALTSLRIGDFVAVELAPAGLLASKDEGSAAFRASYCENDMYDFKLIF
jgi:hypothetical protein